jgi:hypothetical protein
MSGPDSRPRRTLLALIGAGLLAISAVGPATATMYSSERYSGSDSWSYGDCGPVVDVTAEWGGLFQIRTGTGRFESAFFAQDNYWWRETHVRRSDGKTIVLSADGLFKETRATHVEGSIFTFTAVNAGQLFVARDGDGNVLFRDRGAIRETILFDTTGDDVPGGIFLGILDQSFHGQFPSSDIDFCQLWAA